MRPEVETRTDAEVQARFEGTAWTRCDSWYRDKTGRIVANWPGYMREYEDEVRTLNPRDYSLVPLAAHVPASTG